MIKSKIFTDKKIIIDILNKFHLKIEVNYLIIVGNLNTERNFYTLVEKLEPINIDINDYIGIKDYEVEWELNELQEARQKK